MFFSSVNKTRSNITPQYTINGTMLDNCTSIIDLGITVTTDLTFNDHIASTVSKALQRSGVFFRGFSSRDLILLRKAFITYIRPIVEYDSVIWNPTSVHLTDLLESVQRKFTKRIHSISHLSYSERLSKLSLESLELRRLRFDLTHYFKFLILKQPPGLHARFVLHMPPNSARSTFPVLSRPARSSVKLDSTFFYRQTNAWNSLPLTLKSCNSLPIFKRRLLETNLTAFLVGSMYRE